MANMDEQPKPHPLSIRKVAPAIASLILVCAVVSCTSAPPVARSSQQGAVSPGNSSQAEATAPPPDRPGPLRLPGMDAGTKSLLTAGPTKGSRIIGAVPGKGRLWVMFDCQGAGRAEIILAPAVNLPFTCLKETLTPTLNQLNLNSKTALTVRVQAPDSVEWALRVTR